MHTFLFLQNYFLKRFIDGKLSFFRFFLFICTYYLALIKDKKIIKKSYESRKRFQLVEKGQKKYLIRHKIKMEYCAKSCQFDPLKPRKPSRA